jgi:hypothetical protein
MAAPWFNRATGLWIITAVFGEPHNRYIQCAGCCEQVMLGGGAFRGHIVSHSKCGTDMQIDHQAKIQVRS